MYIEENNNFYFIGRLENVYEDEIIVRIRENVFDEKKFFHKFKSIDDLDQFLNRVFEINLTKEFKDYFLIQKVMNKLTR